ncbi:hypothetical protein TCE0_044r16128 [Talaromyces pinophilus]|uniref:Major facilitator superfamily (MFS) profile domain-containing protein n=1 Tax=Talaromyces pinophilus TaxID=128442 RepID=A0A478EB51_TALPI|nr:hypothetical protein TCE0_044r16128 [Talaromyces pinophilus]
MPATSSSMASSMATKYPRHYVSKLVPRSTAVITTLIMATSVMDSLLLGYDSSLMGNFNVMPMYSSYFTLTTATKSLNTAISYVGGACAAFMAGFVTDWRGRRETIFWSSVITLIGAAMQGAAQNISMFIVGRFILGFGMGFAAVAAPTYVSETVPHKWRGLALGLNSACWSLGTLLASGICYRTQNLPSTWAWRAPSVAMAFWSVTCAVLLPFTPESPRWLVAQDRHDEALEVLAVVNAGGDKLDHAVLLQHREISDTIAWEKGDGRQLTLREAWTNPGNRKRIIITATFPAMVMLSGVNVVAYYFGTMLEQAGITSPSKQLEVNLIMVAICLVVAVVASYFVDKVSRKGLASWSLIAQIVTLYIFGGLSAKYGNSTDTSGIYGTIAMLFLFTSAFSAGINVLTVIYPPEVLSYPIRATGMGLFIMIERLCGLFVTMVFPFALNAIGWKTYMINASFDILLVLFVIFYWVETRGLTLEEVDIKFDGEKHSAVPNLHDLGKAREESGKLDWLIEGVPLPVDEGVAVETLVDGKGKDS